MNAIVQKYGGSSVKSLGAIEKIASSIASLHKSGKKVACVVSAMGDTTDELLRLGYSVNTEAQGRDLDLLLSSGECVTAALMSLALQKLNIPSVAFTGSQSGIQTDSVHGNARITNIDPNPVLRELDQGKVVVATGFQGEHRETKSITTLGRGGSDLSAVALAVALRADRCELYKDVDGIYSADPKVVPTATIISHLNWATLSKMAWAGASVMHARAVECAEKCKMPIHVRSGESLNRTGTLIDGRIDMEMMRAEAIAHRLGMSLIRVRLSSLECQPEFLAQELMWFWQKGEAPAVTHQTVEPNGSVVLTLLFSSHLLQSYLHRLGNGVNGCIGIPVVEQTLEGLACVTVVGTGLKQSPETFLKIMQALSGRPHFLETQNSSVVLVVNESVANQTLNSLHAALFESEENLDSLETEKTLVQSNA